VTLRAFVDACRYQLQILGDLDATLLGKTNGALEWYVTDLRLGSLEAAIQSGFVAEDAPEAHDRNVARAYRNGMYAIQGEGRSPEYYSERDLTAARQTFRLIGRDGVTGFLVAVDSEDPVPIDATAAAHIEQLIHPGERTFGSVEGKLTMISVAGRKPRVTIVDAVSKKGVSCHFEESHLDEMKDGLGKRVIAEGLLTYNRKGEPQRLHVESFRIIPDREALPSSDELLRAIPNLSDGLTTAEHMSLIRGE
jgi:hypothetical protein